MWPVEQDKPLIRPPHWRPLSGRTTRTTSTLAAFGVDKKTGMLTVIDSYPTAKQHLNLIREISELRK
jgi:hypothetical protein